MKNKPIPEKWIKEMYKDFNFVTGLRVQAVLKNDIYNQPVIDYHSGYASNPIILSIKGVTDKQVPLSAEKARKLAKLLLQAAEMAENMEKE